MHAARCPRCSEPKKSHENLCVTCTFMEAEPLKKNKQKINTTSTELGLLQSDSMEVASPEAPTELLIV